MNDIDSARRDYLALREHANSAQLATLGSDRAPESSYAPCVTYEGSYYLFLSRLASHTDNLMRNPEIGLMLLEDEAGAANPFARKRINLQGRAETVARDSAQFRIVLDLFHHRFGKVMEIIEPLPDFQLFCVHPETGRFVRGFGQAYQLEGDRLDRLTHVDPGQSSEDV